MWPISHVRLKVVLISVSAFDRAYDAVKNEAVSP